jgi:hypothetical protein
MKNHARIASGEPIDDCANEGRGQPGRGPNVNFTGRRIGNRLYVLYAATQIIKYGNSTIEQRTTVFRRRNPLAVAIQQTISK